MSPTNENDWIIDPFAGTDLPQLLLLVAEKFMEITVEPTNLISMASFIEKHPKDSANIHLWASMYVSDDFKVCYKKLIPFKTKLAL